MVKNRNFGQKSKFWLKIEISHKNYTILSIIFFRRNFKTKHPNWNSVRVRAWRKPSTNRIASIFMRRRYCNTRHEKGRLANLPQKLDNNSNRGVNFMTNFFGLKKQKKTRDVYLPCEFWMENEMPYMILLQKRTAL